LPIVYAKVETRHGATYVVTKDGYRIRIVRARNGKGTAAFLAKLLNKGYVRIGGFDPSNFPPEGLTEGMRAFNQMKPK
jgi:hypothetical protein